MFFSLGLGNILSTIADAEPRKEKVLLLWIYLGGEAGIKTINQ